MKYRVDAYYSLERIITAANAITNRYGRLHKAFLIVPLVGVFLLGGLPGYAAQPAHHHHAGDAVLELNHGKKWQTDAPLRAAMGALHKAFAADLAAIHENRLSKEGYAALAALVNQEVARMVAQCQLPPDADAQLHLIIAELTAGAEQMSSSAPLDALRAGAVRVVKALGSYGHYFEDAGFVPLAH
ncbi:Hypothetical protein HDN1F_21030 [gamma proteobacterium HdN1]|nr:Hypothetical protein HDN1F_21030 [gamma proteobacterium HdN1]